MVPMRTTAINHNAPSRYIYRQDRKFTKKAQTRAGAVAYGVAVVVDADGAPTKERAAFDPRAVGDPVVGDEVCLLRAKGAVEVSTTVLADELFVLRKITDRRAVLGQLEPVRQLATLLVDALSAR
jgi:hypothetical protein